MTGKRPWEMRGCMSRPEPVPFPAPPRFGEALEVASGVRWLRLALPFRLDHVNIYLIEDGDGWLLIDTGVGNAASLAFWNSMLEAGSSGPLSGRPISRILVTHHHPDHLGAAGYLAARTGAPLLMSETEYLTALHLVRGSHTCEDEHVTRFYKQLGLGPDQVTALAGHLPRYRAVVPDLPSSFQPLRAGDQISAGSRRWTVLLEPGHAPAQVLLHAAEDNILIAADHVLTRISPNISVLDRSPEDDPLGRYLASLQNLRGLVPDSGLVLPGHHLPFRILHERTRELEAHHEERCLQIARACHERGRTVAELLPALFPFMLDAHQLWFAFSEILAHLNYMARHGRLEPRDSHGRRRWGVPGRSSHGV